MNNILFPALIAVILVAVVILLVKLLKKNKS